MWTKSFRWSRFKLFRAEPYSCTIDTIKRWRYFGPYIFTYLWGADAGIKKKKKHEVCRATVEAWHSPAKMVCINVPRSVFLQVSHSEPAEQWPRPYVLHLMHADCIGWILIYMLEFWVSRPKGHTVCYRPYNSPVPFAWFVPNCIPLPLTSQIYQTLIIVPAL